MEMKASKVVSALDFLQQLALNPSAPVPTKHRSILDEVRKSYCSNTKSTKSGKKRKQPPSKSAPKPKRQRTSAKGRYRRSDKEENDEDDRDGAGELISKEDAELIEDNAIERGIRGNSPSHFSYFNEDEGVFIADKEALSPLWKRGDPRHCDLDNYLHSVAKIFYHPIEAMDQHLTIQHRAKSNNSSQSNQPIDITTSSSNTTDSNSVNPEKKVKRGRGRPKGSKNKKGVKSDHLNHSNHPNNSNLTEEQKIFRYSTINLILSPLRKRSPIDEWNPREVALFESAMCCKGKQFYEISKIVGTKNTKQCVEFYYHWKQSSNYAVWKALGRKTNKKATSSSQRKLHKKIGQKFAEFHAKHSKSTQNGGAASPKEQVHSIQNDLNQLTVNGNNTNGAVTTNGNNGHAASHGAAAVNSAINAVEANDHALLLQQQLNSQQQQQAAMGMMGYYPQYYAQTPNGYPWYHPQQTAYYQQQMTKQSMSNGQDSSNIPKSPNKNGSNGINGGGGSADKAMCIDLTETSSVNGEAPSKVTTTTVNQAATNVVPPVPGSTTSTAGTKPTDPITIQNAIQSDNVSNAGKPMGESIQSKGSEKENVNELASSDRQNQIQVQNSNI